MKKIIIWGTGSSANRVFKLLNDNCKVIGFVDNNEKRWSEKFLGCDVYEPNEIKNFSYHYIVIASQYNDEIYNQLISMDIDSSCIFDFRNFVMFNYDGLQKNTKCLLIIKIKLME